MLEIVAEFNAIIEKCDDQPCRTTGIERHAFYEEARRAYLIVHSAETRLYGNIILSKGVVAPQ